MVNDLLGKLGKGYRQKIIRENKQIFVISETNNLNDMKVLL